MTTYIDEIRGILASARKNAFNAVNTAMVEAYWLIGKRIIEQEQHGEDRAVYGEGILKELSKALTAEFGRGFSYANLRNFRQFYLTYRNNKRGCLKRYPLFVYSKLEDFHFSTNIGKSFTTSVVIHLLAIFSSFIITIERIIWV